MVLLRERILEFSTGNDATVSAPIWDALLPALQRRSSKIVVPGTMNRIKTTLTATALLAHSTVASVHAGSNAPTVVAHVERMNTLIFCACIHQRTANSIKADDPAAAMLLHERADDVLDAAYAAALKARDAGHLPGGNADIRRHVERLHMSTRAGAELLTPKQLAEKRDWCQRVVRGRQ